MANKNDRFVVTYKQGNAFSGYVKILIDRETGVNYINLQEGYGTSITPLLDRDGKPVVTSVYDN